MTRQDKNFDLIVKEWLKESENELKKQPSPQPPLRDRIKKNQSAKITTEEKEKD